MFTRNPVQPVSEPPTNPGPQEGPKAFDVADLYRGPIAEPVAPDGGRPLDEKLRQAYFWIVNNAIISPHYDIEYNEAPPASYQFGGPGTTIRLPSGQCYSSF